MNEQYIAGALESILFITGDPVEIDVLAAALDTKREKLIEAADKLSASRLVNNSGILIKRVEDKLQLCTNEAYAQYVETIVSPVKKSRLSQSMIETLAIIAYKQPITRFEIEQIRGVKSNYSVATLIEKGLIERAGRKKSLGNPMLYVTSDEFLRHFNLSSLKDLPPVSIAE
ncbi:MAG: SMC-Scp complex subunit ScpB [Christensenellales bacterium]